MSLLGSGGVQTDFFAAPSSPFFRHFPFPVSSTLSRVRLFRWRRECSCSRSRAPSRRIGLGHVSPFSLFPFPFSKLPFWCDDRLQIAPMVSSLRRVAVVRALPSWICPVTETFLAGRSPGEAWLGLSSYALLSQPLNNLFLPFTTLTFFFFSLREKESRLPPCPLFYPVFFLSRPLFSFPTLPGSL